MLARISTHLSETRVSSTVDWAVLAVGVLMLTTAVVGTVMAPGVSIQAEVDLATGASAAL